MSKGLRYSVEMLDFIKLNYKTMEINHLTIVFNQRFNLDKTPYQIRRVIANNKFINDLNWRAPKSKKSVPSSVTIEQLASSVRIEQLASSVRIEQLASSVRIEQLAFIAETYLVYRAVDIPKLFYQQFGIHKTYQQIKSLINRNGIRSGRLWHSKPGVVLKASSSTFKKDRFPHNHLPIGRFRVTNTGFPQYKIADPNIWVNESTLVWEAHHGDIPEGMSIYYKDGNRLNPRLDNLVVANKCEGGYLTALGLKSAPDEFKESVVIMAKINAKISELTSSRSLL
ncbi:HNH endonuclease signature motif containing protein [Shewanella sp. MTB7]|uniref:HNH endonuclease signature motif containing protein n=2 Tax=unclassified Shewanella TaxID=196818 RepID=UPI0022BA6E96|nr:HNH endonuclease signature motif containing protein [Shewanella sp. MTB7]WBJ96710.1 HNH endonuclease [Shewanella sp. MTB7]